MAVSLNASGCENLRGAEIQVCNGITNCEVCGHIEDAPRGEWLTVICQDGRMDSATIITFSNHGVDLLFCEFEVFGKLLGEALDVYMFYWTNIYGDNYNFLCPCSNNFPDKLLKMFCATTYLQIFVSQITMNSIRIVFKSICTVSEKL